MPYQKDAAGNWVQVAGVKAGPVTSKPRKGQLFIIDKQVDPEGALQNSVLDVVQVLTFDSSVDTTSELIRKIRKAHLNRGHPFKSISLANHGNCGDNQFSWKWTKDLAVPLNNTSHVIELLMPILDVMKAALIPSRFGVSHITFLSCGLASRNPDLIPALEKLYHIDFRASTDDTGNEDLGGDWDLETDDYDFASAHLDPEKMKEYREKMGVNVTLKVKRGQKMKVTLRSGGGNSRQVVRERRKRDNSSDDSTEDSQ
eukprot:m.11703 g.11703  ORF g.11703 m.11703 type:complete len:257 (+) comp4507_c1_seq1:61-831(+)